jgi:hypothetical protein
VVKREKKKSGCVIPHQGLGDIMLCVGAFRQLSSRFHVLKIVVSEKNRVELTPFLSDLDNVKFLRLPSFPKAHVFRYVPQIWAEIFFFVHRLAGYVCIGLGGLGKNFLSPTSEIRFDENFYRQAEVDFRHRWSSFEFIRDLEAEARLSERLKLDGSPYVFLHEDASRGFTINRAKIDKNIRIIEPLNPSHGYRIVDYVSVILAAHEIHTIESSFAALIEGLEETPTKHAHRYARPEALRDWRHEFTYKSPWTIHAK